MKVSVKFSVRLLTPLILATLLLNCLLCPSAGMDLQRLRIKFSGSPSPILGMGVTIKMVVTDNSGNAHPVLAHDLEVKLDGQPVVTAPHGMFQAAPSLAEPPPSALQSLLKLPPDEVNKTFFLFDARKVGAFLKTHKDAVWYHTTESLAPGHLYLLDVEVKDGTASGSGRWSIFIPASKQPPSPPARKPDG